MEHTMNLKAKKRYEDSNNAPSNYADRLFTLSRIHLLCAALFYDQDVADCTWTENAWPALNRSYAYK